MICTPCSVQADLGLHGPNSHIVCLGKSWCDCQHMEVSVNGSETNESEATSEVREGVSVGNEDI